MDMDSEPAIFSSFAKLNKMGFSYKTQSFWFTKRSGLVLHFSHLPSSEGNIGHRGMTDPLGIFLDVQYNTATVL